MSLPSWRNPAFNALGTIDCEILSPRYGWVPFTVNPADTGAGFNVAALDAAIRAAGPVPPYVPPAGPTPAELRVRMRAFRRAFRAELRSRPVSQIPALAAIVPDAPHLLAAADAFAASLDPYHPVRDVWQDVNEFLRLHPDMALFTAAPPDGFGVSEEWLDDLFTKAMAREA